MKKLHYIPLLSFIVLFSSCSNVAQNIGWTGLIILFGVLMALSIFMFYLIQKRKRKGNKSLAQFSANINTMLAKYEKPENKIEVLKILIERINEDEKYKKDTTWRNQVLAKTYLHLATQYNAIGDMQMTLQTCSQILELTPDDAMTLYNRGSIYSNIGDNEKALLDLSRSIELVDDYASSYNNRGMILTKLERYDEAIADFAKALELEESAVTYYNRGVTLKRQSKEEEALSDLQKALDLCSEYDEDLKIEISNTMQSLFKS